MKTLHAHSSVCSRMGSVPRAIMPGLTCALLCLAVAVTGGCKSDAQAPVDCICTTEFVTISFTVVDDTNTPVPDVAVQSRIQRTGRILQIDQALADQGVYFAATDAQIKEIRHAGEVLVVAGTLGQRTFTETFEVNVPGVCACHIAKVSGPETIMVGRGSP